MQAPKKLPKHTIEVGWTDLTDLRNLELLIHRAKKKEVPELLLKTLSLVDAGRHKGKNLACRINYTELYIACRIIQRSQSADNTKVTFDDDLTRKNPHPEDAGEYDNPRDDLHAARPAVLRKRIIGYHHG